MNLSSRFLRPWLCLVMLVGATLLTAQSSCPDIQHDSINGYVDYGVTQSADVTVKLLNDDAGSWSDDQKGVIEDAADAIMAQPGDNGNATTSDPSNTASVSGASLASPIVVVKMTNLQADLTSDCGTEQNPFPGACTDTHNAIIPGSTATNTISATITVLASNANGAYLAAWMAHEFGHAFLGYAECPGCADTIANNAIGAGSPTVPNNPCDYNFSKNDWCKCNLAK